jgi:IclR family pca regulon transcriptional regulator
MPSKKSPKDSDLFASSSSKALTRGLEILRLLVESEPMTSTEVAARLGLHQSSASRILKTLSAAGYVRKPTYQSFTVDYGVLTLGGRAVRNFQLMTRPRAVLVAMAEENPDFLVTLSTLWQNELIYLVRAQRGQEVVSGHAGSYPLHLSTVALRLLLDRPEKEAVATLSASKRRYGWERPSELVPETPAECIKAARKFLRHDCLALVDWQGKGLIGASIPITAKGEPVSALALSGKLGSHSVDSVLLKLQDGRRAIEAALA